MVSTGFSVEFIDHMLNRDSSTLRLHIRITLCVFYNKTNYIFNLDSLARPETFQRLRDRGSNFLLHHCKRYCLARHSLPITCCIRFICLPITDLRSCVVIDWWSVSLLCLVLALTRRTDSPIYGLPSTPTVHTQQVLCKPNFPNLKLGLMIFNLQYVRWPPVHSFALSFVAYQELEDQKAAWACLTRPWTYWQAQETSWRSW